MAAKSYTRMSDPNSCWQVGETERSKGRQLLEFELWMGQRKIQGFPGDTENPTNTMYSIGGVLTMGMKDLGLLFYKRSVLHF